MRVARSAATHAATASRRAADGLPPSDDAAWRSIGQSRAGRPLWGLRAGTGPRRISVIAGCHADEPVGPATAAALGDFLASAPGAAAWRERATFRIVAHANPDGAADNLAWCDRECWDLGEFVAHAARELPGDDVEFGFPGVGGDPLSEASTPLRPENRAVADFLAADGEGYDLHATLHGMAFAEGAWILVGDPSERTAPLRDALAACARRLGLPLHDLDRGGEKGFVRIGPGFSTPPTSRAMREHFLAMGDAAEAARFRPSSMEFAAALDPGRATLPVVSEVPLFLVRRSTTGGPPGADFLEVRGALPTARLLYLGGDDAPLRELEARWGLEPVPTEHAAALQLALVLHGVIPAGELVASIATR